MESLLSVEGKDPLEANKILKAADVWEDGTHLLSTFQFQALTLSMPTTTPTRCVLLLPTVAHRESWNTSLASKCPQASEENQVQLSGYGGFEVWGSMWINCKRGDFEHFKWKHRKYEGCWGGTNVEQQGIILG